MALSDFSERIIDTYEQMSASWKQSATAFAEAAFAQKQARERQHAENAAQIAQWLQKQRQSGKTAEQIQGELFSLWKDRNRQAQAKQQQQKKGLTLSQMPQFKRINLGRAT